MIGPNGGGKSTLLRIVAGDEQADAGELTTRRGLVVAYLPQQLEGDERTAEATLAAARPDLHELERELAEVERALTGAGEDLDRIAKLLRRQEGLLERWTAAGGPGFQGRARALLAGVGLADEELGKSTRVLYACGSSSGGAPRRTLRSKTTTSKPRWRRNAARIGVYSCARVPPAADRLSGATDICNRRVASLLSTGAASASPR